MRIHREWGSVRIELGRLWLIWCAPDRPSTSGHPNIAGHPNKWMIVWRRTLPEWDPKTKWQGSDEPGPYFKGCIRRQLREPGDPLTGCKFPKCDCLRHLPEWKREELRRLHAESAAEAKRYREAWIARKCGERDGAG
jgi:hypothetical protein